MDDPRRRGGREPLGQINITPLVDVILVLLIIFMVTASLGQQGITVHLPQAKASPLKVADDRITVSIDAGLKIYINTTQVERRDLTARLTALVGSRQDKTVFLKSDKSVSYGDFVEVVSRIKAAGVENLGMITDVPTKAP
jgi:biopolymer transport protein TolR